MPYMPLTVTRLIVGLLALCLVAPIVARESIAVTVPTTAIAQSTDATPNPAEDDSGPDDMIARTSRLARRRRSLSPDAPTIASGGLGLTEDQFAAIHGDTRPANLGRVYPVENGTIITYANRQNPIEIVERTYPMGASINDARRDSQALMPEDAIFLETFVTSLGVTVDLYTSESLLSLFPDAESWPGAEPGQFTVGYFDYNPNGGAMEVTRWILATGNFRAA